MKIQISGIKTKEDIITASYEGADALGFFIGTVYKGHDEISIITLKKLLKYLPAFVAPVMITYFSMPEAILAVAEETKITTIQIGQNVTPENIKKIKLLKPNIKIIKEIKIKNEINQMDLKGMEHVDIFVLNCSENKDVPLNVLKQIISSLNNPVMLSGVDLNILKEIRPYGVVLNEEVNGHDGYKSSAKIRRFITELKGDQARNYYYKFI